MKTQLCPLAPNGMRSATCEMPHMESISLGLWTETGSRHEPGRINGVAHFIEHLLFKGTSKRDAFAISREIEQLGASIDAFTVEDHTGYQIKGPADHTAPLIEILADLYLHPTFDSKEIESERNVIHEEIAMVRDVPSQWLEDLLSRAAWGDHPLGCPITGTSTTLDAISRESVVDFYHAGYTGRQTVFAAAGKLEHGRLSDLVSAAFGEMPRGEPLQMAPAPAISPGLAFEQSDTEQANLAIGFHAFDRHDDRRFALKLLSTMLGEIMSSRLFQTLREEEGLCYDVGSEVMAFADAGMLHCYIGLDPANVPAALESIRRVLRGFIERPPPQAELDAVKSYTIAQGRIALENTSAQMAWAGDCLMSYGEVFSPQRAYEKFAAVTVAEIQTLAETLFSNDRLILAGVAGAETQDALASFRI